MQACASQPGITPTVPYASQPSAKLGSSKFDDHLGPNLRALCPDVVLGFFRCLAIMRTDVRYDRPPEYRAVTGIAEADLALAAAKNYYGPFGPSQLQQIYSLPSAKAGKGQTVAVVDAFSDSTVASDLTKYRKTFKLPPCTVASGCFRVLNQKGKPSPLPAPNPGWAGEISLDVQMVSAICPNCKIVLVEADNNSDKNLAIAVGAAQRAGAAQISNSYGSPECVDHKGKIICQSPENFASYYNIPKTIITASTGDSSWFAGPQWPADFGTVIAVGGTSTYPYDNKRGWFETAWTDGGSGCSKYIMRPSWIPKRIVKCPGDTRGIADVSADADPYTGVLVYETYPYTKGYFYVFGGTSVSSPIIASVYALAGNATSQTYGASLYAPGASLNDVVVGKNGIPGTENDAGQTCTPTKICVAMPGWDGPTGNGTPSGVGAF
jgi:subtilase family serine protease